MKREIEKKFLILKKENIDFFNKYRIESRKILRNTRKLKFSDFSIVNMEKKYHIELNMNESKMYFITLPETYNTKKIHTHNLRIFFNNIRIEPLESNDPNLSKLNKIYQVKSINQSLQNLDQTFEKILNPNNKKTFKECEINKPLKKFRDKIVEIKQIYEDNIDKIIIYYQEYYNIYLEDIKTTRNIQERLDLKSLDFVEKQLKNKTLNLLKKIPNRRRIFKNNIAELYRWIGILSEIKSEHLIAIEIPGKKKTHCNITILTEETFEGCALIRKKNKSNKFFFGESVEYLLHIPHNKNASTYYELIPPDKTRIASVYAPEDISNCNIMMVDQSEGNDIGEIKFEEKFNERFVLHILRENAEKEIPNIYIKFRPLKMLQIWVFLSLLLGMSNIFFMLFLFFNNYLKFFNLNIISFKDIIRYIVPLIYGLNIGNSLWLQEPRFLWRNTTYLSIIIIVSGIVLNCFYLILVI